MFSWICGFAPGMFKEEFERNNEAAFANHHSPIRS
jgi:hypothetical protein